MITDREIWACALQVMKSHGDAAAFHAAQRADELFDGGDHEGSKVWIAIMKRIEELEQWPAGPVN